MWFVAGDDLADAALQAANAYKSSNTVPNLSAANDTGCPFSIDNLGWVQVRIFVTG